MKIVSDGTIQGTHIYTDDGEELKGVISFRIVGTTNGVEMELSLWLPKIEMVVDDINVEIKTIKEEEEYGL